MWETWVRSLGKEDPLEKEMATHSSILAWRIPWMEDPGGLQSTGLQRVGHDWAASLTQMADILLLPEFPQGSPAHIEGLQLLMTVKSFLLVWQEIHHFSMVLQNIKLCFTLHADIILYIFELVFWLKVDLIQIWACEYTYSFLSLCDPMSCRKGDPFQGWKCTLV